MFQQRYHEAEHHLLAGHAILGKQTDPSISWLRAAREDLVTVYDALKHPERAQTYGAQLPK
jgi:eukaryotic-like serine/threonine-protein kinase